MTQDTKIQLIREWLEKWGWAENRELPDYTAANARPFDNPSLADLVYDLLYPQSPGDTGKYEKE